MLTLDGVRLHLGHELLHTLNARATRVIRSNAINDGQQIFVRVAIIKQVVWEAPRGWGSSKIGVPDGDLHGVICTRAARR